VTKPFEIFLEYAEQTGRRVLPYGLMVVLLGFNNIAVPFSLTSDIKAPLFLMALYYWSIYRPTLVPPWLAFLCGVAADVLSGGPMGLSACLFVLIQWLVSDQRRFLMGQSFVVVWIGFFFVSIIAALIEWLLFGLVHFNWPSLQPKLFSVLLGFSIFPFICLCLHLTHKVLPARGLKA
jgi:rod shape-determining protein MreD